MLFFFNAFFKQKKTFFFKKVHLIEKCSGTQNTVCQKYFFCCMKFFYIFHHFQPKDTGYLYLDLERGKYILWKNKSYWQRK